MGRSSRSRITTTSSNNNSTGVSSGGGPSSPARAAKNSTVAASAGEEVAHYYHDHGAYHRNMNEQQPHPAAGGGQPHPHHQAASPNYHHGPHNQQQHPAAPSVAAYAQQQQLQQQQQWPLPQPSPFPPGPPPPPPHPMQQEESQNKNSLNSSIRQPRSRLFQRSASFPPKNSNPPKPPPQPQPKSQQRSRLFKRSSSLDQKPPQSQPPQPQQEPQYQPQQQQQQPKWKAALESPSISKSPNPPQKLKFIPKSPSVNSKAAAANSTQSHVAKMTSANKQFPVKKMTLAAASIKSPVNNMAISTANQQSPVKMTGMVGMATAVAATDSFSAGDANNVVHSSSNKNNKSSSSSMMIKKPSTFQSRDEALKVLKQRRRAKAVVTWKENLVCSGGSAAAATAGGKSSKLKILYNGHGKDEVSNVNGGIEDEGFYERNDYTANDGDREYPTIHKGTATGGNAQNLKEKGKGVKNEGSGKSNNAKLSGWGEVGNDDDDIDSIMSMSISEETSDDSDAEVNAIASLTALEQLKRKEQNETDTNLRADDGVDDDSVDRPSISPLTAAMNLAAENATDLMDTTEDEREDNDDEGVLMLSVAARDDGVITAKPRGEPAKSKKSGQKKSIDTAMKLKEKNSEVAMTTRANESDFVNMEDRLELELPIVAAAKSSGESSTNIKSGRKRKKCDTLDSNSSRETESSMDMIANESVFVDTEDEHEGESLSAFTSAAAAAAAAAACKLRGGGSIKSAPSDINENEESMEPQMLQRAQNNPIAISKRKKQKKKKKQQQQQLLSINKECGLLSCSSSRLTMPMTILAQAQSDPMTTAASEGNKRKKQEKAVNAASTPSLPNKRSLASDDKRDGVTRILQSNLQKSLLRKNNKLRRQKNNISSYMDADGDYVNSIVIPLPSQINEGDDNNNNDDKSNNNNEDGNTPLMELWRKERRKKKKKQKTTRLFLSNGINNNDNDKYGIGRKKIHKRNQLFRHQLFLPEDFSSYASSSAGMDAHKNEGDRRSEGGGCPPPPQGREQKNAAAEGALKGSVSLEVYSTHHGSLWDNWDVDDALSSDDDEEKVEIDVIGADDEDQLEIQSRSLPFSHTLFWSQPVLVVGQSQIDRSSPPLVDDNDGGNGDACKGKTMRIMSALRKRIERADALIQLKAPSYVEFQAKQWLTTASAITNAEPAISTTATAAQNDDSNNSTMAAKAAPLPQELTNDAPVARTIAGKRNWEHSNKGTTATNVACAPPLQPPPQSPPQAALTDAVQAAPAPATTTTITAAPLTVRRPINYQEQQTFFTLPPRFKSYASSNSAQDFLAALHSAATEATSTAATAATASGRIVIGANGDVYNNTLPSTSSATSIVTEFLVIVKESRTNPQQLQQQSPFHLMKKVWTLILSVVSRCLRPNQGARLGKELAAKFDAFLPEGYSMVSSNLLLLEGSLQQSNKDDGKSNTTLNNHLVEGCARTDKEFRGEHFR